MYEFILGIIFIATGMFFINSSLKLKKTKDIKLIKNTMVDINKIKDKDSYVRFNFKINIIEGFICVIQGLICILSNYFSIVANIQWATDIGFGLILFIFLYQIMFKAPKF